MTFCDTNFTTKLGTFSLWKWWKMTTKSCPELFIIKLQSIEYGNNILRLNYNNNPNFCIDITIKFLIPPVGEPDLEWEAFSHAGEGNPPKTEKSCWSFGGSVIAGFNCTSVLVLSTGQGPLSLSSSGIWNRSFPACTHFKRHFQWIVTCTRHSWEWHTAEVLDQLPPFLILKRRNLEALATVRLVQKQPNWRKKYLLN